MKIGEVIAAVKIVQLFPNNNLEKRINKTFVGSVNMKNVLSIYKLADVFNLKNPAEHSLRRIEGSFAIVADTKDFLELDYEQVAKILGRSALQIVSEVEIFTFADLWLRHNFVERRKYAKQLLLKVRVKFLSEHALKHIKRENSAFSECCVEILNKLGENVLIQNHSRRHYNGDNFNFLTYRDYESENSDIRLNYSYNNKDVDLIDGKSLKTLKILAPLKKTIHGSKTVVIKDEVYVFDGNFDYYNSINSIERYSFKTNAWDIVSNIFDQHVLFSACAFIDSIFFMGGSYYSPNNVTESCLKFDTKRKDWKKVSSMNKARRCSASVVFQSNIVISGGIGVNNNVLRSVETYDVFANKWIQMPDMIRGKFNHKLVSVKKKLFVIDDRETTHCEIFDNHSNKFVTFREMSLFFRQFTRFNHVFSNGNKLIFFPNGIMSVFTYDTLEKIWYKQCLPAKMGCYTFVQVPWF